MPEAIVTEEVGHLVKIWLDAAPALGAELDRWLDEHPLPRGVCELNPDEARSAARRRHETFVRGVIAWEHQPPEVWHDWVRELRAELQRLSALRRGNVGD